MNCLKRLLILSLLIVLPLSMSSCGFLKGKFATKPDKKVEIWWGSRVQCIDFLKDNKSAWSDQWVVQELESYKK